MQNNIKIGLLTIGLLFTISAVLLGYYFLFYGKYILESIPMALVLIVFYFLASGLWYWWEIRKTKSFTRDKNNV